jgi:hypothetical protein
MCRSPRRTCIYSSGERFEIGVQHIHFNQFPVVRSTRSGCTVNIITDQPELGPTLGEEQPEPEPNGSV